MRYLRRKLNCYTTREAAKRLGVSLRTVQLWVDSGHLEAWKTRGGHRRISIVSVERLLKDGPVAEAPQVPTEPLKLLVVEDDNIMLKLYRMRIAEWQLPIEVATVSNGYEALIRVGRESPDLMISDLRMPGMNGFDMVRTLVSSSFRDGMEIVVVSGLDESEFDNYGGLPASVKVFRKPVPFAELRDIAAQMLTRRASMAMAHDERAGMAGE